MNQRLLSLRVDQPYPGAFVWVITELGDDSHDIEVAASLETYGSASEALAAGAQVLEREAGS